MQHSFEFLFTREELLATRDALIELYVAQRAHVAAEGDKASEGAKRRLAVLEALKDDFKEKCFHMKG